MRARKMPREILQSSAKDTEGRAALEETGEHLEKSSRQDPVRRVPTIKIILVYEGPGQRQKWELETLGSLQDSIHSERLERQTEHL